MDAKDKRDRKPNFSENEVKSLLEGITEEKDVIHSHSQSTTKFCNSEKEQESRAVAKITARCAQCMGDLKKCRIA